MAFLWYFLGGSHGAWWLLGEFTVIRKILNKNGSIGIFNAETILAICRMGIPWPRLQSNFSVAA